MKFNCGPTRKEKRLAKIEKKQKWHTWYAWHPVRVGHECFWLEEVLRKGLYFPSGNCGIGFWAYSYRAKGTTYE